MPTKRNGEQVLMTPVAWVKAQAGGGRGLARHLGIDPAAVSRWGTRRAGRIPDEYHVEILNLADKHQWDVTTDDLIYGRRDHVAA